MPNEQKMEPSHPVLAIGVILLAILAGVQFSAISTSSSSRTTITTTRPNNVVVLADGITSFPLVAFGLQVYDSEEKAYNVTRMALHAGFRNFMVDTQHQSTFAQACADSAVPRSDLFITGSVHAAEWADREEDEMTKMGWLDSLHDSKSPDYAYDFTRRSCQENIKAFAVAGHIHYLDQMLLDGAAPGVACDYIRGQWRALEEFVLIKKQVMTLAVSNFSPKQLDCLLQDPQLKVRPVINQLPYNVAYHPANTIEENRRRGLLVQAWSPLGGSHTSKFNELIRATCADIGETYKGNSLHGKKSFAQVALRWIVQKGAAIVTHSSVREHCKDDLDIFDFELSLTDMATLDSLVAPS